MRKTDITSTLLSDRTKATANHYKALPVIINSAQGSTVTDVDGNQYIDMLSAYSALNFGHLHPDLVQAATNQLKQVSLTSQAFYSEPYLLFLDKLSSFGGKDKAILMNTGAEAVETSIKMARKWAYEVKNIPNNSAEIIVCNNNFHGRTTTIVSFSSDEVANKHFGPLTDGFISVPFGDATAVANAICENTAAVLVEPVQGEAGIIVPPKNYLKELRQLCTDTNVLLIADEIQSGMSRTLKPFCCQHYDVVPDVYLLGKALGGGIIPVSAVLADAQVMSVFTPGSHGSTFGGNPLGASIGSVAIDLATSKDIIDNATAHSERITSFLDDLIKTENSVVSTYRSKGLWYGIDVADDAPTARQLCEALVDEGLLCKDTQSRTIRLAPPLTISHSELDRALEALDKVLNVSFKS